MLLHQTRTNINQHKLTKTIAINSFTVYNSIVRLIFWSHCSASPVGVHAGLAFIFYGGIIAAVKRIHKLSDYRRYEL
ncbi:hypothetical protein SAMN04488502_10320 [Dendrosporobacter quercicolus]|uniref:Uncharacterized protein n=1 Tax=Dendrosporobacter quercicolus TaxID=146817 RepID=A0A1G9RK87_9FIRM|nr:hypothetical protein SAMN04488502_10320 [Dendrosporobacter quercicolus]